MGSFLKLDILNLIEIVINVDDDISTGILIACINHTFTYIQTRQDKQILIF